MNVYEIAKLARQAAKAAMQDDSSESGIPVWGVIAYAHSKVRQVAREHGIHSVANDDSDRIVREALDEAEAEHDQGKVFSEYVDAISAGDEAVNSRAGYEAFRRQRLHRLNIEEE